MTEQVPDPFPDGYRFGNRYIIECELPPGELGRVYKALDSALNRVVAINVLSVALRNEEGKRRLVHGLSRARRKPIPQAFDFGEAEGVPYVTVAYIDGVGAAIDVAKA